MIRIKQAAYSNYQLIIYIPRWMLIMPIALIAGIMLFGCFYLIHSREYLISWYQNLNSCFYKASEWPKLFFTNEVKSSGNKYSIVALALCLVSILFLYRATKAKKYGGRITINIEKKDLVFIVLLIIIYFLIWVYGFFSSYPSNDETFSVVNCARIHPLQSLSYYMIPNNHIFFNLLNSIPAHLYNQPLTSGRIISGIASGAVIPMLYLWLRSKVQNGYISAVFSLVIMLQFSVWAFSFQARGYAIYYLACWGSVIFADYYLMKKNQLALLFQGLFLVIGFFAVPSFLFWEAGLILYISVKLISRKQFDLPLIFTHAFSAIFVFLLFIPLLCFSGIASLTENAYVTSIAQRGIDFWKIAWNWLQSAIQYCFAADVDGKSILYESLYFLPVASLVILRKTKYFTPVLLSVLMWLAFFLLQIRLHRFPFMRNMLAHDSILIIGVLFSIYGIAEMLFNKKLPWFGLASVSLFSTLIIIHFIRFNVGHVNDTIYFNKVEERYNQIYSVFKTIPHNARVELSDESFYWEYLCVRDGIKASKCMDAATHYIKLKTENLPQYLLGHVQKIATVDDFEIFKLNESHN